jgi:hypothetical protein
MFVIVCMKNNLFIFSEQKGKEKKGRKEKEKKDGKDTAILLIAIVNRQLHDVTVECTNLIYQIRERFVRALTTNNKWNISNIIYRIDEPPRSTPKARLW